MASDNKEYLGVDDIEKNIDALLRQVKKLNEMSETIPSEGEQYKFGVSHASKDGVLEAVEENTTIAYELSSLKNYDMIPNLCVAIIGLTGAAHALLSMLIRSGFVHFILIDDPHVIEWSDMASMGTLPEQIGMTSLQMQRLSSKEVNPAVNLKTLSVNLRNCLSDDSARDAILHALHEGLERDINILADSDSDEYDREINTKTVKTTKVDIVVSFMNSDAERIFISDLCLDVGLPLFDTSIKDFGFSFNLSLIMPGQTACLQCQGTNIPIDVDPTDELRRNPKKHTSTNHSTESHASDAEKRIISAPKVDDYSCVLPSVGKCCQLFLAVLHFSFNSHLFTNFFIL